MEFEQLRQVYMVKVLRLGHLDEVGPVAVQSVGVFEHFLAQETAYLRVAIQE